MPTASSSSEFAARIVETGARGFAGLAASRLLDRNPELEERFAPDALSAWKSHFNQQLLELAAAMSVGEPALFTARVRWSRKSFQAHDQSEDAIRASLGCLREVLLEQLPAAAGPHAEEYLHKAISSLDEPMGVDDEELDPAKANERLALKYIQATLQGDSDKAVGLILEAVEEGLAVRDAYLDVLIPAQHEIGRLWHGGKLAVAEEHFVTNTTERAMALLWQRASRKAPNGKTVIAATVAGNVHDVAVRALSDLFQIEGWRAICLGANVPSSDFPKAVSFFGADLLLLSAALSTQLSSMGGAIAGVRENSEHDVKILVGGLVLQETPDVWKQLGADGYAPDIDSALAAGTKLVGLKG